MSSMTHHVVRRGMETFQSISNNDGEKFVIPSWGATLVAATVLLFAFAIFAADYTYGTLFVTLASVEAPRQTAIITTSPSEESDHPDAPLISVDEKHSLKKDDAEQQQIQDILLISQRPLSSRFCSLRRHLKARAGRLARFRGAHILAINTLLVQLFTSFVTPFFRPQTFAFVFAEIGIYAAFTNLQLCWNHVVISEPSAKSFLQRMPTRDVVKKALLPTLTYAAITKISTLSVFQLASVLGFRTGYTIVPGSESENMLWPSIALLTYGLLIVFGILIPAEIGITRVRASLLAEDVEPIIPFDRTFGGQVVSVADGGKGFLTLKQAIRGADRQVRRRVTGVYLKTMGIQFALMIVGMMAVMGEIRLILEPEQVLKLQDMIREALRAQ